MKQSVPYAREPSLPKVSKTNLTAFLSSIYLHSTSHSTRMVFDTADTFVDMLVVILDCRSRDPHPIYPAGLVGTARGKGSGACSLPPRKIPRFPFVPTPAKQARL